MDVGFLCYILIKCQSLILEILMSGWGCVQLID